VSDILETENSLCIVRVNAREQSKAIPFEEIRVKLKKELESLKTAELEKAFSAKLRKSAKVEEL
jgi:hypothetical protein